MAEDPRKRKPVRTLLDYDRAKRRAECPVCSLPPEISAEIATGRRQKIPQATMLDWLEQDHGIKLSRDEMLRHTAAHHDQWKSEG